MIIPAIEELKNEYLQKLNIIIVLLKWLKKYSISRKITQTAIWEAEQYTSIIDLCNRLSHRRRRNAKNNTNDA